MVSASPDAFTRHNRPSMRRSWYSSLHPTILRILFLEQERDAIRNGIRPMPRGNYPLGAFIRLFHEEARLRSIPLAESVQVRMMSTLLLTFAPSGSLNML